MKFDDRCNYCPIPKEEREKCKSIVEVTGTIFICVRAQLHMRCTEFWQNLIEPFKRLADRISRIWKR